MLTLLARKLFSRPTNNLLVSLLIIFLASCGGGDNGGGSGPADELAQVVARTGPIIANRVGEVAQFSADSSYSTTSAPLSYNWTLLSKPDSSKAELTNTTTQNPRLLPDVKGDYRAQLIVSSGGLTSQPVVQLVVATIAPEPVTGSHFHQGLSSSCESCHNDLFDDIDSKVGSHIASGNKCENCHSPLGFNSVDFVDHQEVSGTCSECHNGQIAIGKSELHLPTNAECDSCHNTTSFFNLEEDGSFDHTDITSGCLRCHTGTAAIGKTPSAADSPPGNHPTTSADCVSCHTTVSFKNAYPDHTDPTIISPGCDSCHNASPVDNISDAPDGHPTMTRIDTATIDCGDCHGIATFSLNGVFNHGLTDSATIRCDTCHNDINSIEAIGKGAAVPSHLSTTQDCGSCHGTETFDIAVLDHSIPPVVGNRCDFCHGVSASGLPADTFGPLPQSLLIYSHMPITITNPGISTPPNNRDCADCHNPGTFMTGTFDHDFSFYSSEPSCADCHNNVITLGKLENHLPTTQDCGACHNTAVFTDAVVDHASLSSAELGNCASCHDGILATGKQLAVHLPTTQNCFECHNVPNVDMSFKQASNFTHAGITGSCESCHGGNPNYIAVGAIDKKVNHIPALDQCLVCHDAALTNPGDFSPSTHFLNSVHPSITNGCEGCHVSSFLPLPSDPAASLLKDANHLPTSQDCSSCHNINAFTPTTMAAHNGINSNCVSCHNGDFVALGARAKTPSPPHPETTADCAQCHDTVNFANAFVDHNDPAVLAVSCVSCHNGTTATGKVDAVPGHVSTSQDCGVCHSAGGSFKPAIFDHTGIVNDCVSCHDGVTATGTDAKTNPPHIPIGAQDCSVCHTPIAFAQATFEHQNISNNCVSCHNGITATGKHNNHVPTNGDCVDCHQTTGFVPATFDHFGIVDNCASCHGAGFATPKTANHVATTKDCGTCHNTTGFTPATFDHTGITNDCQSCHDGSTATGKDDAIPAHLVTNLDCYSCHTTATFVGGTWTHDASSANTCDTCHSPTGGASSKPGGHLSTTEQCDVCHTTNRWAPTNFNHDPNGDYPGDHRRDPGCAACHGNTITSNIPWRWPQYAPFCAACHANDFERDGDHIGGSNGTVAQNKNCGNSGCHRVSSSGF